MPTTPRPSDPGRDDVVVRASTPTSAWLGIGGAIMAAPFLVVFLIARSPRGLILPLILVVVAGVLIGPTAVRSLHWHRAELVLPNRAVELGGEVHAVYRRRPRRHRDLPTATVETRLRCREKATYRVGTDTRTVTTDVVDTTAVGTGGGTANGFEAPVRVQVPISAGGPTMKLTNNKLQWELAVRAVGGTGSLPDDTLTFPLDVSPVVHPRLRVEQPAPARGRDTPTGTGLDLQVDAWLAELGGVFTGQLTHLPPDEEARSVRGVRLELVYRTEGRGDRDSSVVSVLHYPVDQAGLRVSTRYTLPVPWEVPISYDGRSIRVRWQIRAVVDRSWTTDHSLTVDVVVAPVGAYGLYRTPHPHRSDATGGPPPGPPVGSGPGPVGPPPGPAPRPPDVPPPGPAPQNPTDGPTPPRPSPWGP